MYFLITNSSIVLRITLYLLSNLECKIVLIIVEFLKIKNIYFFNILAIFNYNNRYNL